MVLGEREGSMVQRLSALICDLGDVSSTPRSSSFQFCDLGYINSPP